MKLWIGLFLAIAFFMCVACAANHHCGEKHQDVSMSEMSEWTQKVSEQPSGCHGSPHSACSCGVYNLSVNVGNLSFASTGPLASIDATVLFFTPSHYSLRLFRPPILA